MRLIYIDNALIVSASAPATAANIAAHETLFRWGIVSYLLASVLFLFVTLALYRLLETMLSVVSPRVTSVGNKPAASAFECDSAM